MKKYQVEHETFLKQQTGTDVKGLYQEFIGKYPNLKISFNAFKTKRYELGIKSREGSSKPKHRPIGSEQIKKGFVRVKVAEPNVWVQKQKFIYEQAYGKPKERCNYIFLDGNRRNFALENIMPIPLKLVAIFNGHTGGVVKDNPSQTLLNLQMAYTYHECFILGEKHGLLTKNGIFKSYAREAQSIRNKNLTPEQKEKYKETRRRYYANLPLEQRLKRKIYQREWARRKKAKSTKD